ncbi:MAG: KH domain-containing protein [Sandaracinaceae bacterium]
MADDRDDDDRGDQPGVDQLTDLIDYVARALVDEPDDVTVEAIDSERAVILELTVAPSDLGKVIGKDGRTARAMRTLLAATSARLRRRAVLEILE